MKYLFFVFIFSVITEPSFSQSELSCSKNGSAVIYVNGQENELEDVTRVWIRIQFLTSVIYSNQKLDSKSVVFDYSYNRTFGKNQNGVPLADFLESAVLILASRPGVTIEQAWNAVYRTFFNLWEPNDPLDRVLISETQAIELLNTPELLNQLYNATADDLAGLTTKTKSYLAQDKKVIFISHSQGNLFVNATYSLLIEENDLINNKPFVDYFDVFGNLQVASPANVIAIEKGRFVTNNLDAILNVPQRLNPNFFLSLPFEDPRPDISDQSLNHSMLDTYLGGGVGNIVRGNLPELRDRVFNELEQVAFLLESNCDEIEFFLRIDPKGTYLFTDRSFDNPWGPDNANPASRLELNSIPDVEIREGDIISLQTVGASSWFPGGADNLNFGLVGVFVGAGGFLHPGINSTAPEFVTSTTTPRNIPTDIPQDRFIPNDASVDFEVPFGAKAMLFTVNDGFFRDNSDPNGDFGVTVKVTIKRNNLIN